MGVSFFGWLYTQEGHKWEWYTFFHILGQKIFLQITLEIDCWGIPSLFTLWLKINGVQVSWINIKIEEETVHIFLYFLSKAVWFEIAPGPSLS